MRRIFGFAMVLVLLAAGTMNAQEDDYDVPYLLDEDIAALEASIDEGDLGLAWIHSTDFPYETEIIPDEYVEVVIENELGRLNPSSQRLYHLLILDRRFSPPNSRLADTEGMKILYSLGHGARGYLIAVYESAPDGPVFPQMPDRSRVMVNLTTTRKATLTEFVNSATFRRFVTNRGITRDILRTLR